MIALGIETSTDVCSVGLTGHVGKPVERRLVEKRIHSEKLLTLVQDLFSDTGVTRNQITVVAVSIGPGSFTGLRIGLSTAKGLCFSLGVPLVLVPTFDVIARAAGKIHQNAVNIVVALDAKKQDFYVGRFERKEGQIQAADATQLMTGSELLASTRNKRPHLIVTDIEGLFPKSVGGQVIVDVHDFCRGDVVAQEGIERARAGHFADVDACEPMYLKDFVVLRRAPAV